MTGPPPSRSKSTGRSIGDARARRRTTGDPRSSRNCSSCGRRRIRPRPGLAFVSQPRPVRTGLRSQGEKGAARSPWRPLHLSESGRRSSRSRTNHRVRCSVVPHHHLGDHHGGNAAAAARQGAPSTPATARSSAGRWAARSGGLCLRPVRQAGRDVRGPGGRARLALPVVSAFQKRWTPSTTSRRRSCWHSAQPAEWDRSAPRTSLPLAAPVRSGGRLTSSAMHLMTHQNERQMSVTMPLRASFQRQDIARNAHTAHYAHHPNPQVRQPLRWVRGWQRTLRGASSGKHENGTCPDAPVAYATAATFDESHRQR